MLLVAPADIQPAAQAGKGRGLDGQGSGQRVAKAAGLMAPQVRTPGDAAGAGLLLRKVVQGRLQQGQGVCALYLVGKGIEGGKADDVLPDVAGDAEFLEQCLLQQGHGK